MIMILLNKGQLEKRF